MSRVNGSVAEITAFTGSFGRQLKKNKNFINLAIPVTFFYVIKEIYHRNITFCIHSWLRGSLSQFKIRQPSHI